MHSIRELGNHRPLLTVNVRYWPFPLCLSLVACFEFLMRAATDPLTFILVCRLLHPAEAHQQTLVFTHMRDHLRDCTTLPTGTLEGTIPNLTCLTGTRNTKVASSISWTIASTVSLCKLSQHSSISFCRFRDRRTLYMDLTGPNTQLEVPEARAHEACSLLSLHLPYHCLFL